MYLVAGLKVLGGVGTHIFSIIIFFRKKYDIMHFERPFAFQNALNYIFPENTKNILGFTSKYR